MCWTQAICVDTMILILVLNMSFIMWISICISGHRTNFKRIWNSTWHQNHRAPRRKELQDKKSTFNWINNWFRKPQWKDIYDLVVQFLLYEVLLNFSSKSKFKSWKCIVWLYRILLIKIFHYVKHVIFQFKIIFDLPWFGT